ncbi:MAG: hypothetical protein JO083_02105 [Candidatus Eremiobacteraeota bacterium]|nr:hypothetical protein [Candidatus Eremiobacteraeota bacterium]
MEHDEVGYVLYHDPAPNRRLVIFVDGAFEVSVVEAALRRAGAQAAPANDSGYDFILRSPTTSDPHADHHVTIKMGPGSGKSHIATLLWLAATDEGASAARGSVDHDS